MENVFTTQGDGYNAQHQQQILMGDFNLSAMLYEDQRAMMAFNQDRNCMSPQVHM